MPPDPLDLPAADPLVATLLPVLMHRMNNTTQLLSNLTALTARGGGGHWLEERAGDLSDASEVIDEVGYLLAVLACASGADLLLERRVTRGLALAVSAVERALKRDGRDLAAPERPLPGLAPDVGAGWELPWAFASLLLLSGQSLEAGRTLEWQLLEEGSSWVLVGSPTPPDRFGSLASRIAERLPEAKLDACREGWSWRVPSPWLIR